MQASSLQSFSSSTFNSYSSSKLVEIAVRVVEELRTESCNSQIDDTLILKNVEERNDYDVLDEAAEADEETDMRIKEEEDADYGDEFEFAVACESSPISADEIFYDGQIRPMFPVFGRDLAADDYVTAIGNSKPPNRSSGRLSLRKLFMEDRGSSLCSSSNKDEVDRVSQETYCVWTPAKSNASSRRRSRPKSNSAGSSKRWKFRDFLHRSNSDG